MVHPAKLRLHDEMLWATHNIYAAMSHDFVHT